MSVSSELLHGALKALPTELAILDSEGTIVYTNDAWAEFGIENGIIGDPATIGANYFDAMDTSDEYAEQAETGISAVLDGDQETFSFEYPCHSPTQDRWFLMYAAGYPHDGETYVQVGHIDITDRKQAELAVEAQNERLEMLTSILRHDIRNPLNVAQGYLDSVAEYVPEGVSGIGKIRRALERIDTILSDTLVLTGRDSLDSLESVSLRTMADKSWDLVDTKEATLKVADDYSFEADESILRNLFENLFRNAVEHGGASVTVTVGLLPSADGFYVEDNGPGIPKANRDTVFDAGFSTGGERNHGLGLLLVAEVVAAHGWDATITESPTGGARFEITTGETQRNRSPIA